MRALAFSAVCLAASFVLGCSPDADPCARGGGEGAPSTCLSPTLSPAYYVAQANLYFDRLDGTTDPNLAPNYSERVARWEWAPWLKLTGYTRDGMLGADLAARLNTATVPERDCRAFEVQPFARCYVRFLYADGYCAIYEEFTFDDDGEMTFIEAWSNMPEYLPMADPNDTWAEGPRVHRMSTKLAGLGSPSGLIDPMGAYITHDGLHDPEVLDFALRTQDFYSYFLDEHLIQGADYFARGCGW